MSGLPFPGGSETRFWLSPSPWTQTFVREKVLGVFHHGSFLFPLPEPRDIPLSFRFQGTVCKLNSLMGPGKVIHVQFVQLFLILRMLGQPPSSVHVGPETQPISGFSFPHDLVLPGIIDFI